MQYQCGRARGRVVLSVRVVEGCCGGACHNLTIITLLHTWIISVIAKHSIVQVGQIDGPTEYL